MITSANEYQTWLDAVAQGQYDIQIGNIDHDVYHINGRPVDIEDLISKGYFTNPDDYIEDVVTVNINDRSINVPSSLSTFGIVKDHNVETLIFAMQRFFDEYDFSDGHWIAVVQYLNANGEAFWYRIPRITSYDNFITFGWQISENVTKSAGNITFSIRFYQTGTDYKYTAKYSTILNMDSPTLSQIKEGQEYTIDDIKKLHTFTNNEALEVFTDKYFYVSNIEGVIKYRWNSKTATGKILTGLDIGDEEAVTKQASDLEALMADYLEAVQRLEGISATVEDFRNQIDEAVRDAITDSVKDQITEITQGAESIKDWLTAAQNDLTRISMIVSEFEKMDLSKLDEEKEKALLEIQGSLNEALNQIGLNANEYLNTLDKIYEAAKVNIEGVSSQAQSDFDTLKSDASNRIKLIEEELRNQAGDAVTSFENWLNNNLIDKELDPTSSNLIENKAIAKGIVHSGRVMDTSERHIADVNTVLKMFPTTESSINYWNIDFDITNEFIEDAIKQDLTGLQFSLMCAPVSNVTPSPYVTLTYDENGELKGEVNKQLPKNIYDRLIWNNDTLTLKAQTIVVTMYSCYIRYGIAPEQRDFLFKNVDENESLIPSIDGKKENEGRCFTSGLVSVGSDSSASNTEDKFKIYKTENGVKVIRLSNLDKNKAIDIELSALATVDSVNQLKDTIDTDINQKLETIDASINNIVSDKIGDLGKDEEENEISVADALDTLTTKHNTDVTNINQTIAELQERLEGIAFTPIVIKEFTVTPAYVEIGTVIQKDEVEFNYETSKEATSHTITGEQDSYESDTTKSFDFTLTVQGVSPTDTDSATASMIFCYSTKYGVSENTTEFPELVDSVLLPTSEGSYAMNAGANEYLWFAIPKDYSDIEFVVGGFSGGFDLIGEKDNYVYYRSTNKNLGSQTVQIIKKG